MKSLGLSDWLHIQDQLDHKYHIQATDAGKRFIWVIVGTFPVAVLLHIVGAVKRGQRTGFWIVRRDAEGYIFANRHVLVHALSAFKTVLATVALILLQHDIRTHLHSTCVAFQACGFVLMHIHNWYRTWSSIYSMPPTSLHLNLKKGQGRNVFGQTDRSLPPWLFNFGLVGGTLYGIILTVTSTTIICTSINRGNSLYHTVSDLLDEIIVLAQDPTPEAKVHMMHNAALLHTGTEDMKMETMRIFHAFQYLVCGFVAINIISVSLFWWSLYAIVRCMDKQLAIFGQCLQHREEAIQLGMISVCKDAIMFNETKSNHTVVKTKNPDLDDAPLPCNTSHTTRDGSFNWKALLPTFKGDEITADHLLWKSHFMRSIKPEGSGYKARLRSDYSILRRCKTNTIWEAIFITCISLSYTSMAISLGVNVFDVPQRTSITQMGYYVMLWSNTIWVFGGTGVALISARVAFIGPYTSMDQQASADEECRAESFDY